MVLRLERLLFMDSTQRLAALFVDGGKRVSVLRHTLPKLKSLSIYAHRVDEASGHIRTEVAPRHFALDRLHAEIDHALKFTPLCV